MRNQELMMSNDGSGYSTPAGVKSSGSSSSGGSGMDPASAGIMVGGSFLSQYLAQRAQEEENRKKMLAQAELAKGEASKEGADLQNRAFGDLMGAWKQSLSLR